jgi:hypothetical protein
MFSNDQKRSEHKLFFILLNSCICALEQFNVAYINLQMAATWGNIDNVFSS